MLSTANLLPRVNLLKTVMTVVEKICPEKKHEFANVCLARNTVTFHQILRDSWGTSGVFFISLR